MAERSEEEIDDEINRAADSIAAGTTKWPSMTYEQGVDAALRWVAGWEEAKPMDE